MLVYITEEALRNPSIRRGVNNKELGGSTMVPSAVPKLTTDEWCVEGSQTHVDHIAATE